MAYGPSKLYKKAFRGQLGDEELRHSDTSLRGKHLDRRALRWGYRISRTGVTWLIRDDVCRNQQATVDNGLGTDRY